MQMALWVLLQAGEDQIPDGTALKHRDLRCFSLAATNLAVQGNLPLPMPFPTGRFLTYTGSDLAP